MFSEHLFQEHLPNGSFSLNNINSRQLLTNILFKGIKKKKKKKKKKPKKKKKKKKKTPKKQKEWYLSIVLNKGQSDPIDMLMPYY